MGCVHQHISETQISDKFCHTALRSFFRYLDFLPVRKSLVVHPSAAGINDRRSLIRRTWFYSLLGGKANFKRVTDVRNKINISQTPLDIMWMWCDLLSVLFFPVEWWWVAVMLARREQNLLISLPEYNKEKVVLCYDLLQIKQSGTEIMFFFFKPVALFHAFQHFWGVLESEYLLL